ncbi:helix-turn-helix domain-containing protein [Streptomyces sp. NBC_01077]|uniref:helix-turn-helix domain-containing protein n=1 Tax=Streptomyces sp. NBC_01077 TaxID=2903746 RepID=UPI003866754C
MTAVIARDLRVSARWVERWRRSWREGGMEGSCSVGRANSPAVADARFGAGGGTRQKPGSARVRRRTPGPDPDSAGFVVAERQGRNEPFGP